ncbi:hypothetical protein [Herbaspirillum sp. CF444]|uniref:hypothetical protein n=1 Tax=Herbaspirillum sp. CF444 TaxID=1144319 RepID=UPI0012FC87BF|nr:hypothetical protein [Herbaspirillum sp. CF444]
MQGLAGGRIADIQISAEQRNALRQHALLFDDMNALCSTALINDDIVEQKIRCQEQKRHHCHAAGIGNGHTDGVDLSVGQAGPCCFGFFDRTYHRSAFCDWNAACTMHT